MAIIDIVTYQGGTDEFVWKFPSENLRLGTQLVVKPGQSAFFVKGGVICDEIDSGTVTLQSANIPLLTRLLSLPFGGRTPFQAEVWFVNRITKLNANWGTPKPIQLEDPRYGIIVPVRAFGQFGFRVADARKFLETLVGTAKVFTSGQVTDYFKGGLISAVNIAVGKALSAQNISITQIASYMDQIAAFCQEQAGAVFEQFGLELVNFFFHSINVPEDDPSLASLKGVKEQLARMNVLGRDIYQFDRSMDVLGAAAANQGVGGSIVQSGLGLGVGMVVGSHVGQQAGQMVTQIGGSTSGPPPVPTAPAAELYVHHNQQQVGPITLQMFEQMVRAGVFAASSLVWRQGMSDWQPASMIPELAGLFTTTRQGPPPVPPAVPPTT